MRALIFFFFFFGGVAGVDRSKIDCDNGCGRIILYDFKQVGRENCQFRG